MQQLRGDESGAVRQFLFDGAKRSRHFAHHLVRLPSLTTGVPVALTPDKGRSLDALSCAITQLYLTSYCLRREAWESSPYIWLGASLALQVFLLMCSAHNQSSILRLRHGVHADDAHD